MLKSQLKATISILTAIAVVAVVGLASVSSAAGPKVSITGDSPASYAFKPKTVHVSKGSTVHWSWASNAPHNVTFKTLSDHSATGASGSFKLKFAQAGTYKYICTVHGFKGKVVVK